MTAGRIMGVTLGFVVGNFTWQLLKLVFGRQADWRKAVERSSFQLALALALSITLEVG